eukprot:CAMPEP_0168351176 /NCGR_PEP_ID=MMETSP0213-20121227/21660_1 /TAXON_ID=151035 /ORGANISM="Euplotes harpa, Strain FSP1.4" /LENGTH=143 /DNA_ID=CAMNT_0008361867 /DNA_START=46 /DNA_END=473 /DNA_ORIENTATION=+
MANWFGRNDRGFWFGVWAANPNVGNIMGSLLCNLFNSQMKFAWVWVWILISVLIGIVGLLNLVFLVEHPSEVGIVINEDENEELYQTIDTENQQLYTQVENNRLHEPENLVTSILHDISSSHNHIHHKEKSINFFKAWFIPGV